MAQASTNRSSGMASGSDTTVDTEGPILLFDGHCGTCKQLAHRTRNEADELEIHALTTPTAQSLLAEFYPNGWEHDFYLITDGKCKKGMRAVPSIARLTGIRSFGGLVKQFMSLESADEGCGCDDDHEHSADADSGFSRRKFVGAASAAAASVPFTGVGAAQAGANLQDPPEDLEVHVARISRDGTGGYEVDIQTRPDLARSEHGLKENDIGRERLLGGDKPKEPEPDVNVKEIVSSDSQELSARSLGTATASVGRMDKEIAVDNPDRDMRHVLDVRSGATAQTTQYYGTVDHERFGMQLNIAKGPAKRGDTTDVFSTMSGSVEHDVSQPLVDFMVADFDGQASETIQSYGTAATALADFYAERGNTDMAGVYREVATNADALYAEFDGNIDESLELESNIVPVSGLPGYEGFAEPPEYSDVDSAEVTGQGCSFSCSCPGGTCCGCGLGCGVCAPSPCSFCYCCYVGCGCGYECCF